MRLHALKNKKRTTALLITLVLVLAAGSAIYALKRDTNPSSNDQTDAQTTSEEPTAQPDFTDGTDREPGSNLNENKGSGSISDSGGRDSSDTSKPIVSDTGEITVYLPHKNSLIKSGQEISGTSTLSTVSYRILDSLTGQIASGQLKVVDGKFSGTIDFDTGAREGRIDIFGTKADWTEFSNIEIPVRFQ